MITAMVRFKAGHAWEYANKAGKLLCATSPRAAMRELLTPLPAGQTAAEFKQWLERNIGGRVIALR